MKQRSCWVYHGTYSQSRFKMIQTSIPGIDLGMTNVCLHIIEWSICEFMNTRSDLRQPIIGHAMMASKTNLNPDSSKFEKLLL